MLATNPLRIDLILGVLILILIAAMIYNHTNQSQPDTDRSEGLGVTQLITMVKEELIATEQTRQTLDQAALFELKDFDLEINFVVRNSRSADGKVGPQFLTVEAGMEVSSERVQKIRLHMSAIPSKPMQTIMSPSAIPTPPDAVPINPPPFKKQEQP